MLSLYQAPPIPPHLIFLTLTQACALSYFVTFLYGTELWHFTTLPGLSFARTLKWLIIVATVGAIPLSLWNIYKHYRTTR